VQHLSNGDQKINPDGTYTTSALFEVVAPYTPGSLRVEAWAPGIISLEVAPQRTGVSMEGNGDIREDHASKTVMSPFGKYAIIVQTRTAVNIDIRYAFDQ